MSTIFVPEVTPKASSATENTPTEQGENKTHIRGLRLAHLWAIVPIAIAWFVQSTDTIEPFDFWWNVKSGEIMTQTGRFLSTEVLVWTPTRLPYYNPQWGSQLIFYWLYNASPYLLLTARTAIIVATLGFIMWLCFSRSGSLHVASVVTLITYFTGWTNYGMRPQLLAFLPFILFFFLLERKDTHPKWLPLLVPIMLYWVNVHGSFFLGAALAVIYAVGTLLEKLPSQEGRKWLASRAFAWQAVWLAAALLMTLANPYVTDIYNYFFVATNDPIARALNIEWQAPTLYDGTGILFYSNVLIFLASAYLSKRRMRPTEILLVLAFGYLALTSIRNVIWWGWVVAPIIAANFAAIAASRAARRSLTPINDFASGQMQLLEPNEPTSRRIELPALNWLLASLLVGSMFAVTPLWRPINPFLPEQNRSAISDNTPIKLAAFVKQNHPPAPVFNYMEWGGYLEWELYEEYQSKPMFIDGRFEARKVTVWEDYISISRGRADWQDALNRYGIKTLILNKDFHSSLISFVRASNVWQKVYEDKMGVVFTR